MKNKLWRITLDTNPEDCNLHCIMCEEHSPYSDFKEQLLKQTGVRNRRMPKEWINNIFNEAHKLGVKEIIPSTMGEPLLYNNIDLFFQLAKKYDIKINLTTNGTFPGKSIEEWATLIIPVTSDTKISINGSTKITAENIMQGLDFDEQLYSIRRFVAFRNQHYKQTGFYSRITLQLTFMQNNMHELIEIIKLAAELDIDRIKGHHLWTHFEEIKKLSFKQDAESMQKWNTIVDDANKAVKKYLKPDGKQIILEQIDYLQKQESAEVPYEYDCPFLEKELWISATGKISPCCAPDQQRNSLGDFGNYPETNINNVLNSSQYNDLVMNYKQHALCKKCVMRKPIK